MKRYIYGLFAFLPAMLMALAGTSCIGDNEPLPVDEPASDCFNLVVKVPQKASSRAAVTELNEFVVRSLHLYFYASAGHDDATSLSLFDRVVDVDINTSGTVQVALPANALLDGGIFGASGTQCIVYAVANVDATILPEGTPMTINGLKGTTIGSTFNETKVQDSFAMDGKATVTIDRAERKATGEIELTRAAAKLTLSVELPASITAPVINQDGTTSKDETREYTPSTGEMRVWIGNGVKQSALNTAAVPVAEDYLYSNAINATNGSEFSYDEAMTKYKYVQNVPFYSYPNKWEAATPDGNTQITMVIPWKFTNADGTPGQVTTYYRLAVQPDMCCIERNMHYDMRVSINRLGGVEPQTPVDMKNDWSYAIPWNTQTLETDIKAIRYLLLNNNYYDSSIGAYSFVMNNETDLSVTLGTSHDVVIASVTMSWRDYYNNANRSIPLGGTATDSYSYSSISGYNAGSDFAGIEVDNNLSTLKFKRDMRHIAWNNGASITTNAAFCAYTFDIVIRHIDDASQKAKVRITQYPPIYITSQETTSGDYRFVNTYNSNLWWDPGNGIGYVASSGSGDLYLGAMGSKSNHHTYIINISKFGKDDTGYIIADPRTRSIDNLPSGNTSKTNPASWSNSSLTIVDGESSRKLTNYYPTDDSDSKTDYMAPRFRIASQWGVTNQLTLTGARRRCASYQENGRPAGRWRLPTVAEIRYIATLSSKNYIPYLFGDQGATGVNYWCGSGAIIVNNTNPPSIEVVTTSSNSKNRVRCVYDEWYWGTDTLTTKNNFRWGDRQRSPSGN